MVRTKRGISGIHYVKEEQLEEEEGEGVETVDQEDGEEVIEEAVEGNSMYKWKGNITPMDLIIRLRLVSSLVPPSIRMYGE